MCFKYTEYWWFTHYNINDWLTVNTWLKVKNTNCKRKIQSEYSQLNPDIHSPPQCCAGPWHTYALSQWSPWQHGPHRSASGWAPWCPWRQARKRCEVFHLLLLCWRWRCCCSTGCWSPWAPAVPASGPWSLWGWDSGLQPDLRYIQLGSAPSLCPPRTVWAGW